ncbi:MAG: TIGR01777 family oxidoreductase [Solirubrobacteraceae bacterium]
MRVLITGATGTIGLATADALRARGDQVVALSRDPDRGQRVLGEGVEVHGWAEPTSAPPPSEALAGADAVIHLLGEPVAQRWSEEAKGKIRDSRVLPTRQLVGALSQLSDSERPKVLVSQSATGYYGPRGDAPLDEDAAAGQDFLAEVVVAWEQEASAAASLMRVATTRTGVVLSPSAGALAKMLPAFKLGVGGPVAGGRQYVSWIHLDDVVGALLCCADQAEASGPVNVTAPNAVTNAELSRALGHALGRPAVLPVPGFAVKLLYGEMAEMVTTGQRVVPARLRALGYEFRHPEVEPALRDVLSAS